MTRITDHFTLEELCASDTARAKGISNVPNATQTDALKKLVTNILEPARQEIGKPMMVTSGYRCKELNTAVGGKATSQHLKGQAADIQCAELRRLFMILSNMDVDQLLYEKNSKGIRWIHVSYVSSAKNRHQIIDNYIVQ